MRVERPAAGSTNGREPTTGTMKAIVRDRYGDTEVLRLDDVPRPVPGDHDVVVRVAIAGLDRGAWHWMTGLPYLSRAVFGLRRPKNLILGTEVAGTVEAVGPAVTTFSVGEEVFGFGRGAFAEYALVADDRLAHKPSGLSFEQAATLPVSGVTALQAVHDHGRVQEASASSSRVPRAVSAASPSSWPRPRGHTSPGCAAPARPISCGPSGRMTSSTTPARTSPTAAGGTTSSSTSRGTRHWPACVAPSPRTEPPSSTGGENGGSLTGGMNRQLAALVLSRFVGQRFTMFIANVRWPDLERLATLVTEGKITPRVDRTYPLDQVPDAMRRLEAGQACGKIAIAVGAGDAAETATPAS